MSGNRGGGIAPTLVQDKHTYWSSEQSGGLAQEIYETEIYKHIPQSPP